MSVTRKYRRILSLFFLLALSPLAAQDLLYHKNSIGFNVGAHVALGNRFQRFGLLLNFFYVNNFVQTNTSVRAYFNFKNLGPSAMYSELVVSQGIVAGFGKRNNERINPFLNSVSNQTQRNNSIAYSYNLYMNKIKTTQVTGIAAFQFGDISFIVENDILAKPILDRFRTGAFLIQYQYKDQYQAALNCTMFTGQMGKTVPHEKFPSGCYMDTTDGRYTNYSHGLLSAQFNYHVGLGQTMQFNAGVDAEQVRNVMQNRLIHDFFFLPKSWFHRTNCHIPMLDEKGEQYLYKENQKIRKAKAYFNFFSNANLFY